MEKVGMQITLTEILARLDIPRSQRSSALGTRICNIMTKNGFRRIRAQKDGVRGTYYKYITPLDELDYREETAPVEPDEPEGYEYQTPEEIERDKKMLEAEFADHDEEDYL